MTAITETEITPLYWDLEPITEDFGGFEALAKALGVKE